MHVIFHDLNSHGCNTHLLPLTVYKMDLFIFIRSKIKILFIKYTFYA
eukprot:UN05414